MSSAYCVKCKDLSHSGDCFEVVKGKRQLMTEPFKVDEEQKKSNVALKKVYFSSARKMCQDNEKTINLERKLLSSAQAVVCLMFYESEGTLLYVASNSGFPKDIKQKIRALRNACRISSSHALADRYCAEEHILAEHRDKNFLFSIAYRKGGSVEACSKCKQILSTYGIEDISF